MPFKHSEIIDDINAADADATADIDDVVDPLDSEDNQPSFFLDLIPGDEE